MATQRDASASARSPRSRRNRPCDFCRYRKVACKISSAGSPCELCVAKQQDCTFEQAPRKRRRVQASDTADAEDPVPGMSPDHDLLNLDLDVFDNPVAEANIHSPLRDHALSDVKSSPTSLPDLPATTSAASSEARSCPPEDDVVSPTRSRRSPSPLLRFVGSSGDLDTHLLAHRHYDDQNFSISKHTHIVYQRLQSLDRSLEESKPPPMVTLCRDHALLRGHEIIDDRRVQEAREEVEQLLNRDMVARLSALFARFVHPHLPIIPMTTLIAESSVLFGSPALLAAIAATASHFIAYDDVLCLETAVPASPKRLWQLSWQLLQQELASPRLSTVQTLILLLHRHMPDELSLEGSMDSNIRSLLVTSTHSLGLNNEPSHWNTLEPGERELRRCLWWVSWVTEKWMAFSDGMPSQYHESENSVAPLAELDVAALDDTWLGHGQSSFAHLSRLTFILDDVRRSYFTLTATERTSSSLPVSLNLAKNLRLRLKAWFDGLPDELQSNCRRPVAETDEVEGPSRNFSLSLAYMTTQLAIYRALIRPISLFALKFDGEYSEVHSFDMDFDAAEAVVEGAISNTKSLVSSLTKLTTAEWDSFWPGWSRHNFASISTLLLHLYLLTSRFQTWRKGNHYSSDQCNLPVLVNQFEQLQGLMPKWRRHLMLASRGAGGRKGLTNLALLRLDALMNEWKAGSPGS